MRRDYVAIRPRKVFGYASLLKAFAQHLVDCDLEERGRTQVVISSSETLSDEDRRLMERAYGGPVYNRYNSRENAAVASECRERAGLHVHADHVYLEILRGGRPAPAGQPGHVVLTDLDSYAMPFIRYKNEDISSWSGEECPCGRPWPLLEKVFGRETDFLFDGEGRSYPGISLMGPLRRAFDGRRIRQYQFWQEAKGRITVKAVRGVDWREDDGQELARVLAGFFEGSMRIEIEWADFIQAEPSGKTRLIKSKIPFPSGRG